MNWTGFIFPIGSAVLGSLAFGGISWAGYVLIPFVAVAISVELATGWLLYKFPEKNGTSYEISIVGAVVEVLAYSGTAMFLLFGGWTVLAGFFTGVAVLDAINATVGT